MMELDKFLDWDGYEVIDAALYDEKINFLCKNHDFYLIFELDSSSVSYNGEMDDFLEDMKDPDIFINFYKRIEEIYLVDALKGMTIEQLGDCCHGPFLFDPSYFREKPLEVVGNEKIRVDFQNIIDPNFIISFECQRSDIINNCLGVKETFHKELNVRLDDLKKSIFEDPPWLFNLLKNYNFDQKKAIRILKNINCSKNKRMTIAKI